MLDPGANKMRHGGPGLGSFLVVSCVDFALQAGLDLRRHPRSSLACRCPGLVKSWRSEPLGWAVAAARGGHKQRPLSHCASRDSPHPQSHPQTNGCCTLPLIAVNSLLHLWCKWSAQICSWEQVLGHGLWVPHRLTGKVKKWEPWTVSIHAGGSEEQMNRRMRCWINERIKPS